jgi:hypothetical protein
VGLAFAGLTLWRRQAVAQRNHDAAMRLMAAISRAYFVLDEVRAPHALLSDSPPPVSTDGESTQQYAHRRIYERYRGRVAKLGDAQQARAFAMIEMMETIGDLVGADLVNALSKQEAAVTREAGNYTDTLDPYLDPRTLVSPDKAVLFAPSEEGAADPFADHYQATIAQIRSRLGAAIRMEKPRRPKSGREGLA